MSFREINNRIHDVFHIGNLSHRLERLKKIFRVILVHRRIDLARRDRVHAYALFRVFHCQATSGGLKAAFCDHRNGNVYSGDRVIHQRRRNVDDASAGLLSQHLLDRELGHEEKAFDVHGRERPQIVECVIGEVLREEYTGVVHERVDPAESRHGTVHDLWGRVRVTDVTVDQCKDSETPGTGLFW